MNLTVGCVENIDGKILYHLQNGTEIEKSKWIDLVRRHIERNNNNKVFRKIKSTVTLWNTTDSIEEIALQVYASKYCTDLELDLHYNSNAYKQVKDEMGCNQLCFY